MVMVMGSQVAGSFMMYSGQGARCSRRRMLRRGRRSCEAKACLLPSLRPGKPAQTVAEKLAIPIGRHLPGWLEERSSGSRGVAASAPGMRWTYFFRMHGFPHRSSRRSAVRCVHTGTRLSHDGPPCTVSAFAARSTQLTPRRLRCFLMQHREQSELVSVTPP